MTGTLYVVATPIGNLDDITVRALDTLKYVDLILAEDTRHTLKLLNHFNISKPLDSYHKYSEESKKSEIIDKLLNGKNIALVSDAGTPGISDPGEVLIKASINNNIKVCPIPGCSAIITALSASGLPTSEFIFIGFLPKSKNKRINKLNSLKFLDKTLVFYESPHNILKTLDEIKDVLGDRVVVVARELTKIHEEFIRGTISYVLPNILPKGEFVILVEGDLGDNTLHEFNSLEEHYNYYLNLGYKNKDIIKQIASDNNVHKSEIYKYFINKTKV